MTIPQRRIDLNLIPTMQILLRERSVSRTADILGLTQPAVSAALRRMRETVGDQLLVRVNGKMELTPRAIAMVDAIQITSENIKALFENPSFEPKTATRTFTVATSDMGGFLVLPDWLKRFGEDAPDADMQIVGIGRDLVSLMSSREIDLALLPSYVMETLPPGPLRFRTLIRDESVAVLRVGHPLSELGAIPQSALKDYRMIGCELGLHAIERQRMHPLGLELPHAISVPQATLIPFILLDTNYFAILPSRAAARMSASFPLTIRPLDFQIPEFSMTLAWSQIQNADPAHRWFRMLAEQVVRSLPTAFDTRPHGATPDSDVAYGIIQ